MKRFSSLIILLFFCSSLLSAQAELLGTWYLDNIVKDGITYPNYFNDYNDFSIEFTNDSGLLPDSFSFSMGHGCNSSGGEYTINNDEIVTYIVGTTAQDCLNPAYVIYEVFFYDEIDYGSINGSLFSYSITGEGDDQVLTLTNPNNNNLLVYKKQVPSTLLVSTWWLHHINIPGQPIIDIPETDSPYLNLTNNITNFLIGPDADGYGECESFSCMHNVSFNGANNINIIDFNETLAACATQAYEGIYFSTLSDPNTSFFEYEIIDNGATLILTDLLGVQLIFGDTSLSIDDYNEELSIFIEDNPVSDDLNLSFSDDELLSEEIHFTIYSINGKDIISSKLESQAIDVSILQSGIYFINLKTTKASKTIKFIKK